MCAAGPGGACRAERDTCGHPCSEVVVGNLRRRSPFKESQHDRVQRQIIAELEAGKNTLTAGNPVWTD